MPRAARPERFRDKWRIRWTDHEGRRRGELHERYDDALRALRAHQTEADEIRARLRPAPPADRTFDQLADYWMDHRAIRKKSHKDDKSIIARHLRPAFGPTLIRDLGVEAVDRYLTDRAELAPKTLRNHVVLLGTMLRLAKRLGWLLELPELPKPRVDPRDEADPPALRTDSDVDRFLAAARAEVTEDDPHTDVPLVLYSTALYTGLRKGELAALTWGDVDLQRRTIHVARSFDGTTKTRASRRYVPIVDALLPLLEDWRRRGPEGGGLLFPNRLGKLMDRDHRVFRETLHRVLDRAGLGERGLTFHSLRHSFAVRWRLAGGTLDDLIQVMGHVSREMTKHYANVGGYHRPEHFRIFGPAGSCTNATESVQETGPQA